MTARGNVRAVAPVIFGLLVSVVAWAELSPEIYERMQRDAPEHLIFEVLAVEDRQTDSPKAVVHDVSAEVRVREVMRSATGLKPGAVIRIRYSTTRPKEPTPGGALVPVLRKVAYRAWLRRTKGGTYEPAAEGWSFRD